MLCVRFSCLVVFGGPNPTTKPIIKNIGTAGGTGTVIEYRGEGITDLSMEQRMTICNMSIEAGARAGLVAPDEKTYDYLRNRKYTPKNNYYLTFRF